MVAARRLLAVVLAELEAQRVQERVVDVESASVMPGDEHSIVAMEVPTADVVEDLSGQPVPGA